jgi:Flp pilus assembly protein TadB
VVAERAGGIGRLCRSELSASRTAGVTHRRGEHTSEKREGEAHFDTRRGTTPGEEALFRGLMKELVVVVLLLAVVLLAVVLVVLVVLLLLSVVLVVVAVGLGVKVRVVVGGGAP